MKLKPLSTLAITISLIAGTAPLQAEDLLEIYDLAVQNDPTLREAEQRLFAVRENRPQAQALLLPDFSLSGTARYQDVETTPSDSRFGAARNESFHSTSARATVRQPLFNRGSWMRLSQSKFTISQAEAQYQAAQLELMVKTAQAYFAVLEASDSVRVFESLVAADERQLDQSRQRFEVGLVAITDVNESRAAYDRSRANLIRARNELDNAWEALRRIIGPMSVPLARLGDHVPLSPPDPNDINIWAETALSNNFNVIAAREAAEAARKGIEIERSAFFPTLGAEAGYSLSRSQATGSNDTDTAFIGLNLNVPLYQGGAVASRTRQAGHQFRAAQERLDQQRRETANQVRNAFRGVLSSISDVEARQAAITSARSALESTQAGLDVGTRTQVDVLNAQRNLFQAEFDYMTARYSYIINGILLHQGTSSLNREVLAKGNAWLNPDDQIFPPAH